jgi:hypothetical protein
MEKREKNFGRHLIKIQGFFVFSVFNYLKINVASVVRVWELKTPYFGQKYDFPK